MRGGVGGGGDWIPSGASDRARALILRDNSKSSDGIPEADERGKFRQTVLGFVEEVDQDGLVTKETHVVFQPRNWHLLRGGSILSELPDVKDLRADVALISDHEHGFAGWELDTDKKSPYLDDWMLSDGALQKSTRIVDYRGLKGRTALLAQLVKVTDDHLQQYTAALVMGRTIGEHDVAAAGYVWDNERNFNGLLDTFWITNHEDTFAAGREGTPHGILSLRHDAHVDKGRQHGRIRFVSLDLSKIPECPKPLYKAAMGFDPSVKNDDTENQHESGQWRPYYHCVDEPERPEKPGQPVEVPGSPPPPPPPPPEDDGGGGGGKKKDKEDEVAKKVDQSVKKAEDAIREILEKGGRDDSVDYDENGNPISDEVRRAAEAARRKAAEKALEDELAKIPGSAPSDSGHKPPPGGQDGRIICLPLTHFPPFKEGQIHDEHGYFGMSENKDGGGAQGWLGRLGRWDPLVSVPKETPAGRVPVTDGEGAFSWDTPPPSGPSSGAPATPPTPTKILFDVAGYDEDRGASTVSDGYAWEPNENDPREFRLRRREGGTDTDEALLLDAADSSFYAFEKRVIVKPVGTTEGYVPIADDELGATWVDPASVVNPGPGFWGSGGDGAATVNGGAAPTGMSGPVGIVYKLTKDVFYTDLTISGGYKIDTAGWRIFVSGTLTIGASDRIGNDGNPGVVPGTAGLATTAQTVGKGYGGAVGPSLSAPGGVAGNNGTNSNDSFGGAGGNGGSAAPFVLGGTGGTVTRPASNYGECYQTPQIVLAMLLSYQGIIPLNGGAGGAAGYVEYNAADSGTHTGGGGGGAAGVVDIVAKCLVNNGLITANGGPGGAGSTTGAFVGGGAGGGGGGGGGLVCLTYGSKGSTLGTVQANGGGAGADAGPFTTVAAQAGSAGRTRILAL